jgi:hypothetical protein
MSLDVQTTVSVVIPNGLSIANDILTTVEGYDVIDLTLDGGASDVEVDLQPGAAGAVLYFLIKAKNDAYITDKLSYKIHEAIADEIKLNSMHILTSPELVQASGDYDKLFLSNADTADKDVQIVIGRDVTP